MAPAIGMRSPPAVTRARSAAHPLLAFVLGAALWSCSPSDATEPSAVPPVASPTSAPTATPIPIPNLVLIAEGNPSLADPLREWAAGRGWGTLLVNPQGAGPVLSDPQVELMALISIGVPLDPPDEAPALLVEVEGAAPQGRVSTAGTPGARYDQAGFLAGVMVGLTTQTEWVGQVSGTLAGPALTGHGPPARAGDNLEPTYLAGFEQGLKLGCPRCRVVDLELGVASVDGFRGQGVDVVFVPPAAEAAPIAAALAEAGVWLVWIGELPGTESTAVTGELLANGLAGRVAFALEPLVLGALEALFEGEAGRAWPYAIENGGLVLADLNPLAISPGRQRLLEEAYQAVAGGELDIGLEGP